MIAWTRPSGCAAAATSRIARQMPMAPAVLVPRSLRPLRSAATIRSQPRPSSASQNSIAATETTTERADPSSSTDYDSTASLDGALFASAGAFPSSTHPPAHPHRRLPRCTRRTGALILCVSFSTASCPAAMREPLTCCMHDHSPHAPAEWSPQVTSTSHILLHGHSPHACMATHLSLHAWPLTSCMHHHSPHACMGIL